MKYYRDIALLRWVIVRKGNAWLGTLGPTGTPIGWLK